MSAAPDPEPPSRVELEVSTRTVLRVLATATAFLALLYVLYLARSVLVLLVIALFLALALNPLVGLAERRLRLGRAPATLLVFFTTVILVLAFMAAVLAPLYVEVRAFIDRVPDLVEELRDSRLVRDLDARYDVVDKARTAADDLAGRAPATAGSLLGVASAVLDAVFKFVTVMFLTLFLLLELPTIARSIASLLTPRTADRTTAIAAEVNATVARYVAGNLAVSLIAGVVTYVSLKALGVPFALVLSLLVAFFDLIPLVGATIGSAVVILVAFTQGMVPGIAMAIIAIVYQQVENHLVQPLVMRKSVNVSPFIVIVSVLVGAALLGIVGALLAIPAAGSIQIALRELVEARRHRVTQAHAALLGASSPDAAEAG